MNMLYPLVAEYQALFEDDELDEESLNGMAEIIKADIKAEGENAIKLYKNYVAEAKKFEAEEKRIKANREMFERRADRIKQLVYDSMNLVGLSEIPSEIFTIKIQKNGGLAPLVFDENKEIPDDYCVITKKADNEKIREALKDGKLDFVKLGERGTSLRIK